MIHENQSQYVYAPQHGVSLARGDGDASSDRWKASQCFLPTQISGERRTLLKRERQFDTYNEVCLNGGLSTIMIS